MQENWGKNGEKMGKNGKNLGKRGGKGGFEENLDKNGAFAPCRRRNPRGSNVPRTGQRRRRALRKRAQDTGDTRLLMAVKIPPNGTTGIQCRDNRQRAGIASPTNRQNRNRTAGNSQKWRIESGGMDIHGWKAMQRLTANMP